MVQYEHALADKAEFLYERVHVALAPRDGSVDLRGTLLKLAVDGPALVGSLGKGFAQGGFLSRKACVLSTDMRSVAKGSMFPNLSASKVWNS